jgi:hypothetical protein
MHPHPRAAIERGCSIGANHAQNSRQGNSDPKQALRSQNQDNLSRFQQALYARISYGRHRSNNCCAPTRFEYQRGLLRLPETHHFAQRRTTNEDAFTLDDCSRLFYCPGIRGTRAFGL